MYLKTRWSIENNSVTKMKSIILVICTLAAIASANPFRGVITLKDLSEANCDGAQCPGGCCPADNYVCCEGGYFCGATLADCPMVIQQDEVHAKELEQECEGELCGQRPIAQSVAKLLPYSHVRERWEGDSSPVTAKILLFIIIKRISLVVGFVGVCLYEEVKVDW